MKTFAYFFKSPIISLLSVMIDILDLCSFYISQLSSMAALGKGLSGTSVITGFHYEQSVNYTIPAWPDSPAHLQYSLKGSAQ